jgi:hypothetical protein
MENGHQAMGIRDVLAAAHLMLADEVVLPDVFRDGPATVEAAKEASFTARTSLLGRQFTLAAVAHGKTAQEWVDCYRALAEIPGVGCIHIPKVMDELWPYGGRAGLVHWLDNSPYRAPHVEHHLLGIWTNPIELVSYSRVGWLRGIDTALPVQAAIQGVLFHDKFGLAPDNIVKPKRPTGYFDIQGLDAETLERAEENIRVLDKLAQGWI